MGCEPAECWLVLLAHTGTMPVLTLDSAVLGLDLVAQTGTVRIFRRKFALEDAIGSHTCSLEARACV